MAGITVKYVDIWRETVEHERVMCLLVDMACYEERLLGIDVWERRGQGKPKRITERDGY